MKKNLLILALSGLLSLGANLAQAQTQAQGAPATPGAWTESADGRALGAQKKVKAAKKSHGAKKAAKKKGSSAKKGKKAGGKASLHAAKARRAPSHLH
ncbi:UNVERIFIED_ORG: hypothetical protein LHJ69_18580 [Shinella sp. XGS7]|jgi:hypothetical protein|nr:hypothetical protein [Shinella sp. XGS7]